MTAPGWNCLWLFSELNKRRLHVRVEFPKYSSFTGSHFTYNANSVDDMLISDALLSFAIL